MGKAITQTGGGGGLFLTMLTILFIGLKLTGHISWSWLWVLAPLWAPVVLVLLGLFLFLAISALISSDGRLR